MKNVLSQLASISSTLDELSIARNVSPFSFTPNLLGVQAIPPIFFSSPVALGSVLLATAFMPAGPNTIGGPLGAILDCGGGTTAVYTERFGPGVAGGRRSMSVINSDKSKCTIQLRAEVPGGGAIAAGAVAAVNVAPGASVVFPATLAPGEQFLIQCPEAGGRKNCIYEFRIDLVPPL
jgi:hypothetical protein